MAHQSNRRLASFSREAGTLSVYFAAPGNPDAEGMTPAVVLVEGDGEIVIHAHELARVARLLADAQRLLASADPAPDPAEVRSRRKMRAHIERQAEHGDPTARAERDRLAKVERE